MIYQSIKNKLKILLFVLFYSVHSNAEIVNNIKSKNCEEYVRKELNVIKHGTPGIKRGYENFNKCLNFSIIDNTIKL